MQTIESRFETAKELFIPNEKLFLDGIDTSNHIIMTGIAGSWVGTKSDKDLTPRYKSDPPDKPDFRIIFLDEIESIDIDNVPINGILCKAYIRSLRSQIEHVQESRLKLNGKYNRLYTEMGIFEDYQDELFTLKQEAAHRLSNKPLTRPEHIIRKSKAKDYVDDALKKLNSHIKGDKISFNDIDGYRNSMIVKLYEIMNRWIPRKRNLNESLKELNFEFGTNWVKINETDSAEENFVYPFRERVLFLRNNYELLSNWAKASQPL